MKIAVVGATGLVGETILRVLRERGMDGDVGLFASRSRDNVHLTTDASLEPYNVVFFAGGEEASDLYAHAILQRGGVIIDNSATFRMRKDVELIVPEVNAHVLQKQHRLFPVGNCTAIILCVALAPVRDLAGLRSVQVATYQAISGAGRAMLEEFDRGEGNVVQNVVPQIGSFGEDGWSGEESKVRDETRKILELPDLHVDVMAVRVPVRTAHSEAVFFGTERETSVEDLSAAFERAQGVVFHREGIVTPREVQGSDDVHICRLRTHDPKRFSMFIVGDQLRKGAATNGVQILELLRDNGVVS